MHAQQLYMLKRWEHTDPEACSSQRIWAGGRVAGGKELCLLRVGKSQISMSWALEIITCHGSINRLNFYALIYYLFSKYLFNTHYVPSSILDSGNTVVSKREPLA